MTNTDARTHRERKKKALQLFSLKWHQLSTLYFRKLNFKMGHSYGSKTKALMIKAFFLFFITNTRFSTQICRMREMKVIISRFSKVTNLGGGDLKWYCSKTVVPMLSLMANELFEPLSVVVAASDQKLWCDDQSDSRNVTKGYALMRDFGHWCSNPTNAKWAAITVLRWKIPKAQRHVKNDVLSV